MNALFHAFMKESEPVYDVALITSGGIEYWRHSHANHANNSHSVTKFFIASAIGTLYDKGLLSLEDRVTAFFSPDEKPEGMSPLWDEVTIYDVLRHKIGIEKVPHGVDDDDDDERAIGKDYLGHVFSLEVIHKPDTFYKYSDEAYYLLGRVIHKVTGKPADQYLKETFFDPLAYNQWAMAKCPMGHPICGGGFFARSDDVAKLGWVYANNGLYDGKRLLSEKWITMAMENDFACTRFRDTDIFLKTGANGQCVAFSIKRPSAAAWHGYSTDNGKRNDRLLEAYTRTLDEKFGKL